MAVCFCWFVRHAVCVLLFIRAKRSEPIMHMVACSAYFNIFDWRKLLLCSVQFFGFFFDRIHSMSVDWSKPLTNYCQDLFIIIYRSNLNKQTFVEHCRFIWKRNSALKLSISISLLICSHCLKKKKLLSNLININKMGFELWLVSSRTASPSSHGKWLLLHAILFLFFKLLRYYVNEFLYRIHWFSIWIEPSNTMSTCWILFPPIFFLFFIIFISQPIMLYAWDESIIVFLSHRKTTHWFVDGTMTEME